MAVSITPYNHTTKLLQNKEVSFTALYLKLLSNSASFTASHTSEEQVDNGSKSTVTMTIASPGVITWNSHGLSNGALVMLLTTGALPTGLTAGTWYYVVGATTNTFQLSATSGGSAINTSGSQSGVHTAYAGGSYEVSGNGWTPGGENFANVTSATSTTNDATLDADDISKTASGGSIGPAYKGLIYDKSTMKPLMFVDFGQAEEAGDTTDFKFLIAAAGLITYTYT
jgi:hypothetical protein